MYESTLSTLTDHHSTYGITCADVEPLSGIGKHFSSSQNLRGLIGVESDPLRWKEGGPVLSRAGRVLLLVWEHPVNTHRPSQHLWHNLCVL